MATRHVRTADRRAWYAWKLARRLTAARIRSAAWPPPEEDWCRVVYVGHGQRPPSSRGVMVVEFEPDQPLDVDATWSARLMLPECCRNPRQSVSMDIELDVPEPDGMVDGQHGRGARLHEAALRIGQAWVDHAAHSAASGTEQTPASARPALMVAVPDSHPEEVRQSSVARHGHSDVRGPATHVAAAAGV